MSEVGFWATVVLSDISSTYCLGWYGDASRVGHRAANNGKVQGLVSGELPDASDDELGSPVVYVANCAVCDPVYSCQWP